MKKAIILLFVGAIAMAGHASLLMEDQFTDGVLGTSAQLNGGFSIVGSGGTTTEAPSGDSTENWIQIANAPNESSYGILGANTFNWDSEAAGQEILRTTWVISDSYLKSKVQTLSFSWNDASDTDFSSPAILLELDLVTTNATLFNNTTEVGTIDLDIGFGGDGEFFTVVAEFSANAARLQGEGSLKERDATPLEETFSVPGATWALPEFSGGLKVGAEVVAKANNGLIVEFESVKVEAIPEPAVMTFITIFGFGLIFGRRIFAR
jgi:hypothetical protein